MYLTEFAYLWFWLKHAKFQQNLHLIKWEVLFILMLIDMGYFLMVSVCPATCSVMFLLIVMRLH